MNGTHSLQIQSVLYHNEKEALLQALENLANAIRVDRKTDKVLDKVTVCYGDASKEPLFAENEISQMQNQFSDEFSFVYTFFNENTGTAKGHNRMGETCNSEFMLIMNPDVLVNPHFFAQMLAPFEQDDKAGLTEARQTPLEHHKDYDCETGETSWATTAAAIFPTALFRQVGGFDADTFFMYCDDLDFSWQLRLAGYKIIYVPQAVVFHAKWLDENAGWMPTGSEIYYSAEAALLMAYKWSNPELLQTLIETFSKLPGTPEEKALRAFLERKEEGRLPKCLDPEHRVAEFTIYGYGMSRFTVGAKGE